MTREVQDYHYDICHIISLKYGDTGIKVHQYWKIMDNITVKKQKKPRMIKTTLESKNACICCGWAVALELNTCPQLFR